MKHKTHPASKIIICCLILLGLFCFQTNSFSFVIIGVGHEPGAAFTYPVAFSYGDSTYLTDMDSLNIAGISTNSTSITWSNDRGGSGTASGISSWSANGIKLLTGQNIITVTASQDELGGGSIYTTLALTVTYTPPPTVTVSLPTGGQRLLNPAFSAKGVSSGYSKVTQVLFSLNSGGWNVASGTGNWSAPVNNLIPGTNLLSFIAVDSNGFYSQTNSVLLDFVVTNQLRLSTFGLGTIKPNYSNAWLEIGRNYSITSTPASGFTFNNWIVSTNWTGDAAANSKVVFFMMESNLTLQNNYIETNTPVTVLSSPVPNQKMTNGWAKLIGTASDKWGISNVWYQVNGGTWSQAITTNVWKNWAAIIPLTAGTNAINVRSINLGGKFSLTNNVKVVSSNTFQFQLGSSLTKPLAGNGLDLHLQVSLGITGKIQVSEDLVNWQTLANFVGSNAVLTIHDGSANSFKQRYYRAVTSPP
jgi:hypothetical protein